MLATYEIAITDPVKVFSVDVTGIGQLKYEFTNVTSTSAKLYAVANMVLSADTEVVANYNEPIGLYSDNPALGRDISAYRTYNARQLSRAESSAIMGVNYDNGFETKNNTGVATIVSNVYYNIDNRYTNLAGSYGPLDGTYDSTGNIKIYGDGNLLASLDVRTGDALKSFDIDVTGVTQISFETTARTTKTNTYTWSQTVGSFCVVDMKLSQTEASER
jgi:hypothetical protein